MSTVESLAAKYEIACREIASLKERVERMGKVVEAARHYKGLHEIWQSGFNPEPFPEVQSLIAQMELFEALRGMEGEGGKNRSQATAVGSPRHEQPGPGERGKQSSGFPLTD